MVLRRFCNPAMMCSFGKDSMAMLHISRESGFNLPCIYLHDPWNIEKHLFAYETANKMGLKLHNWPPASMGVKKNDERLELVARYQMGANTFVDLPKNLDIQKPRAPLLCALADILKRPIAGVRHEWDVILVGHKSSDHDPFYGNVPLHIDIKMHTLGEPCLYFPLREWTDEDVWDLIERDHIPYQKNRYRDRAELEDKTFNNDYVQCCSKCLHPENGNVHCPRLNSQINNMYDLVPHLEYEPEYFGGEA
jgi:3'-phosphoadenosine 5'-phosphosulfate sulfotransferase (PAPS reductase)/FAD synthetase